MKEEAVGHEVFIVRLVGEVEGVACAGKHGALQELHVVLAVLLQGDFKVGEETGKFFMVLVAEYIVEFIDFERGLLVGSVCFLV